MPITGQEAKALVVAGCAAEGVDHLTLPVRLLPAPGVRAPGIPSKLEMLAKA